MNEQIMARHSRNDLFTTRECEEILDKVLESRAHGRKGRLVSFEIVPELRSVGYLGEYFHLYLSYAMVDVDQQHVQQLRLFVKSMPWQNVNEADFKENTGILRKETQLYESVLNALKRCSRSVWCADCYMARKDLFVMQNIMDLGYEQLKETKAYLNAAQLRPVLKGLAAMHASSIVYEHKLGVNLGEQLQEVLFEVTVSPTVAWYTAGLRSILAVIRQQPKYAKLATFVQHELPELLDSVYDMVNPSQKYRNVFCHRDVWIGNLFFHKTQPLDVGCVFVDFQLCRYSPPAIDVVQALYLNCLPSVRNAIKEQCCKYYYDCFAAELAAQSLRAADHISYAEFIASFEEFQLFGALYNALVATVLRVPGDYLTDMKQNRPDDFHRYTDVDRTQEVLALMATNSEFRECLYACIDELMQMALQQRRAN